MEKPVYWNYLTNEERQEYEKRERQDKTFAYVLTSIFAWPIIMLFPENLRLMVLIIFCVVWFMAVFADAMLNY